MCFQRVAPSLQRATLLGRQTALDKEVDRGRFAATNVLRPSARIGATFEAAVAYISFESSGRKRHHTGTDVQTAPDLARRSWFEKVSANPQIVPFFTMPGLPRLHDLGLQKLQAEHEK